MGVAKKLEIDNCIVLATAHPSKFPKAISRSINVKNYLPVELEQIKNKEEKFKVLDNNIENIKKYIRGCINVY